MLPFKDLPFSTIEAQIIDIKQIIPQPNVEFLTCPVCYNIFIEPITLSCGHTFCRGCMLKCVQCAICKSHLFHEKRRSLQKNTLICSLIDELTVKCPSVVHDDPPCCLQEIKVKDLESHIKVCPRIHIYCECGVPLPRESYLLTTTVCECEHEECPFCFVVLQTRLLNPHIQACQEELVACEICKGSYKRKNKERHDKNFCFKECPFHQLGCPGKKIISSEFEQHMSQSYYEHFFLTVRNQNPEVFNQIKESVNNLKNGAPIPNANETEDPKTKNKFINVFFQLGEKTIKKSISQNMLIEEVLQEVLESLKIKVQDGNVFLKRANSLAILKTKGTFKEQEVYDYETLELRLNPAKPKISLPAYLVPDQLLKDIDI